MAKRTSRSKKTKNSKNPTDAWLGDLAKTMQKEVSSSVAISCVALTLAIVAFWATNDVRHDVKTELKSSPYDSRVVAKKTNGGGCVHSQT